MIPEAAAMLIVSFPQGAMVHVRTPETLVVPSSARGPQGIQGIQGPAGPMGSTGGTGVVVETAPNMFAARTIVGTSNRIAVANGDGVAGNPAIDIAATYVGQASITTVGTITTGTWAASFPGGGSVLVNTGEVGIRVAPSNTISLRLLAPSSTGTALLGVSMDLTAPATATVATTGYRAVMQTAASAFTLNQLFHFTASATTKGAGSTINNVYGFAALNAIATGTVNRGFYSDIAAATNTWQLSMEGTAPSYFGGPVGVGNSAPATTGFAWLYIAGTHPVAGTTVRGVYAQYTIPSTATNSGNGFVSALSTAAAAFTVAAVNHYDAFSTTVGSGSTITTVRGFIARNLIATGVNNFGFYSDIASASNTYQLYMDGTAQNFFRSPVGIGTNNAAGGNAYLYIAGSNPSTATTTYGALIGFTGPATSTTSVRGVDVQVVTAAAAFTVSNAYHFIASQTTVGAGSAITIVRGFYAASTIANGASNYGFSSDIAAASNTYQLHMAGTAQSYLGGPLGILVTDPLGAGASLLYVADGDTHPSTAVTVYGTRLFYVAPTTATANAYGFHSTVRSTAASYTLSAISHFEASSSLAGAGSTVTNVRGFTANNNIVVGVNNFGFYSDINTASNTWQFYGAGTANSYLGGYLSMLTNAIGTAVVRVGAATTHTNTSTTIQGYYTDLRAPTTATSAFHGNEMRIGTVAGSFTLSSANHFVANVTTVGAGSTITNVRGFYAVNGIATGTNNFGFYSDINTAATTWQVYCVGTAQSYFNGPVGLGHFSPLGTGLAWLYIAGTHPSTSTGMRGVWSNFTAPSTGTNFVYGFQSHITTATAAFTVGALAHFVADTTTLGAGSSATVVRGFYARNQVAVGATNYGFFSDINDATSTYQLAMAGTATSYFIGPVVILSSSISNDFLLRLGVTGSTHPGTATTIHGIGIDFTAPATASTTVRGVFSTIRTASASTISAVHHFQANQTIVGGGGATITNVRGFYAANSLVVSGATTSGFYCDIANATGAWQMVLTGTAPSQITGTVGIGPNVTATANSLRVGAVATITSTTAHAIYVTPAFPSTTTATANGVSSEATTAAASFTLTNLNHFNAAGAAVGAGSTITVVAGFAARNGIAVGGTNYGFFSDINSASNTYQLFMNGTALNLFRGGVLLETTAAPTVGANQIGLGATVATTVGGAGGASALPATPRGYWIINVAGTQRKVPYYDN